MESDKTSLSVTIMVATTRPEGVTYQETTAGVIKDYDKDATLMDILSESASLSKALSQPLAAKHSCVIKIENIEWMFGRPVYGNKP